MNDTLKVAGRIGAELGAAKAEVERLRGLLRTAWRLRPDHDYHDEHMQAEQKAWEVETAEVLNAADALSQQAEPCGGCGNSDESKRCIGCAHPFTPVPTDTYTAVDMATAAAQGFRDGQAAVEQAAAQDELWAVHAQGPDELYAAFGRDDAEQHAAALNALPMPAGIQVSATVIASPWSAAEHWKYLAEQEREHAAELKARAAQTEQQLAADLYEIGGKLLEIAHTKTKAVSTTLMAPRRDYTLKDARATALVMGERLVGMADRLGRAAPIAQTEQQPAYVECRECTDCGHVGINDAHQTDATCAMCDWSGPSPVEDQCPGCGKENAMGAACPKCSGRYRILAETHVAAPIAQTAPQPEQSGLDPHAIAQQVRESLDRQACPNAWMVIAYEATVTALSATPSPAKRGDA